MISRLSNKWSVFQSLPMEHPYESMVEEFVRCQISWFLSERISPELSRVLAKALTLSEKNLNDNMTVKLEMLCSKVALECIPLVNDGLSTLEIYQTNESLKDRCYSEVAEAVVMKFSHLSHLARTHLPDSFTVATIISIMEHYERSLRKYGIHWLGMSLLTRIEDLLDLENESISNSDAGYLTLLLASNGVVNFWDQDFCKRLRARHLQIRLPQIAG